MVSKLNQWVVNNFFNQVWKKKKIINIFYSVFSSLQNFFFEKHYQILLLWNPRLKQLTQALRIEWNQVNEQFRSGIRHFFIYLSNNEAKNTANIHVAMKKFAKFQTYTNKSQYKSMLDTSGSLVSNHLRAHAAFHEMKIFRIPSRTAIILQQKHNQGEKKGRISHT